MFWTNLAGVKDQWPGVVKTEVKFFELHASC